MKLIAQLKLHPTPNQAAALLHTLETANAACNEISALAWQHRTFGKRRLQKCCYTTIRDQFDLAAQMTIRCLAKVGAAYRLDRKTRRHFDPHGAIAYADRILSWALPYCSVSLWTSQGRLRIPFVCGDDQWALLQSRQGESDLVYRGGAWYLLATCEVAEAPVVEVEGVLGVDLGVSNIATDSDGAIYTGTPVKQVRHRHRRLRHKLQKKGTLSAKRRLRKLAGHEARFARDVNHCVSKKLVQTAERTRRGMALEDLTHIRTRVRARRPQRAGLHSWAFAQLQGFIAYKAQRVGIPVCYVDPRNTSRTCPACGHCAKANRRSQAVFLCTACGTAGHADVIAAGNIARRAVVMQPHVSEAAGAVAPETSPSL